MDQHWSHLVSETTLSFSPDCTPDVCPLSISGGSEYGHFCLVGEEVKHNKLIYHSGPTTKLHTHDIILEVQGQKVAGYTSNDLRDWILVAASNSNPVLIKTAKAGTLKKELRPYLNYGFPKGSVDHDTQMTIRENLFQRTVPCTTRPPRDGEINGVDYTFVSLEEFQSLERSGNLLESGGFDGNYYGMPKPPIVSQTAKKDLKSGDTRPGAHPSSKGKRQRNRSTIEATSNKHHPIDNTVHSAHIPGTDIIMPAPSRGPSRGPSDWAHNDRTAQDKERLEGPRKAQLAPPSPGHRPLSQPTTPGDEGMEELPNNWELAYTPEGHMYFIDHNTETTHWTHPRQPPSVVSKNSTPQTSPMEDLPYGWEKVEDPHYGTYYIDHLNRKTQYDAPTKAATVEDELISPSPSAKSVRSVPSYREPDSVSQQHTKPFFSKNPEELSGEVLITSLTKSHRGFGFTIVGGDERDEEFLQIKNVVPHGPADQDGVLRTGDVLVRVNGQLVLGYTHSDVVSMFQTIKPGEKVSLEVCRGYPLAFDPNDPNTEIVTTIAVSMPILTPAEAKQREVERATMEEDDDNSSLNEFADSLLHDITMNESGHAPNAKHGSEFPSGQGQMFSIEIVRGHSGFGFTIADSVNGQKVKHILDPGRCKTLQEGDILVKIASRNVRDMDHLEVVDVLKSCQQGKPTEIVVQRGGFKKVPRPPSQSRTHDDSNGMFKWTVNNSTSQLPRSNLQSTSSFGNRDDDSEGHRTPPPLPSKSRLDSDTTADSKENILSGLPQSSLTEAPSSMILPSQLRDSTNILTSRPQDDKIRASNVPNNMSAPGMLPNKQALGQHPVMNQYNPYYQPPKESFYDVPNKYRNDTGGLTAQQRFDMIAGPPRRPHEFGQPLDSTSRSHPQVLPNLPSVSSSQSQPPLDGRRSRTPGPEHMRAPPDRSTDDRFRSKTPNPGDHRSRAHSIQNNLNQPPSSSIPGATSFENSTPVPSQPSQYAPPPGRKEQWLSLDVSLRRGDHGFGFRIIGGPEEGTQVAIGHIVPGGVADNDRRLKTGDEIVRVDNNHTVGESHHIVVDLMGQASSAGHVNLGVRRKVLLQDTSPTKAPLMHNALPSKQQLPFDVVVRRQEHEGFGFIIVSSVNKGGTIVGRIIDDSPAERCGRLRVGDRILAVNDVDISRMQHEDIVNLIKDSGYAVKLVVVQAAPTGSDKRPNGSMTSATALPSLADNETLVRNMHSHTALSTADRYNNGNSGSAPPIQSSKSAGNLSGKQPSQAFGARSDSRLPSTSSSAAPYDYNLPKYQSPRPSSSYEPTRSAYEPAPLRQSYEPIQRQPSYDPAQRQQTYEPPRPSYEAPRPTSSYDPSKLGIKTPIVAPIRAAPTNPTMPASQTQHTAQPSPGSILSIELMRSSRGFGFSIRGGRQFNNMPLYVLRIAEEGAAHMDQRLLVGDEILEINDQTTNGMSQAEAINLIQSGGSKVKLLIRRTGQLPNIVSEQGIPSPQGSGLSSPAIRSAVSNGVPVMGNVLPASQPVGPQSMGYDPNQNYNKDRYIMPTRQDSQLDQFDSKYSPAQPNSYRADPSRGVNDSIRGGGPAMSRGSSINRGPDMSRTAGYQPERYNPPTSNGRYPDPASSQHQPPRGYPVGRDNVQNSDRLMSNSYPPPPTQHNPNKPSHYNGGTSNMSSYQQAPAHTPQYNNTAQQNHQYQQQPAHTPQYNNTPQQNHAYQQPPAHTPQYNNTAQQNHAYQQPPAHTPQYNNPSPHKQQSYQPPNTGSYTNNGGYSPAQPGGSYNAGAMNRQMNQQMYNYYDRNKPANQPPERQPPIGQNSFDNRGPPPQSNYPSSHNARYNAPAPTYKPMDYGPQGMIRSTATPPHHAPYGGQGQGNAAVTRPAYNNNYNDQPIANNYYTRQPAYQ